MSDVPPQLSRPGGFLKGGHAAYKAEEWEAMKLFLDGVVAKIGDKPSLGPIADGLCNLVVLCREAEQLDIGCAVAAMTTVLSKGDRRELLFTLNQLAGECSPQTDAEASR